MLYPQENARRELRTLDGFWDFQIDPDEAGEAQGWFQALPDPEPMAVPASFNELVARPDLRDYLGSVWYLRRFFVPASWSGRRIWLRLGAVNYRATVWINGQKLMERDGGHLPCEADTASLLKPGAENMVAVRVNNILDWTCIPPGSLETLPGTDKKYLEQHFDFFNYAGLHRSVHLYTTGQTYLADVTVRTAIVEGKARVAYDLTIDGEAARRRVRILDRLGRVAAEQTTHADRGEFTLAAYETWSPDRPCLYKLQVELLDAHGEVIDAYTETFGIRTIEIQGDRILLNGEPIYLKGCCRHDDFHLVGRGLHLPLIQKDLNLLKWLGANSFRTSHYPYAEELMQLADRLGLLVIDECPAVGLRSEHGAFSPARVNDKTLANHCRMLAELYQRDKNHPSVIAWSVANEPESGEPAALPYFERVAATIRRLDGDRPVTMVTCVGVDQEQCGHLFDFICVNRYYGWYSECGRLDAVKERLAHDLRRWHAKYGKPVVLTEFGADTIAGMHALPPQMFSEEYQVEFLRIYGETLDELSFVAGEHVWNLADFMTGQSVRRVLGNRKGVFTRERQPKMAAHFLRERWSKKPS
ncbi:MAG: beta-glucuronidase [Bacteroidota bacterium]